VKRPTSSVKGERRGRQYWESLVREWETTGRSQRDIAASAGVSLATFLYWRTKLKSEAAEHQTDAVRVDFVEVTSLASGERAYSQPVGCRIRVGEDVTVELQSLPPAEWVRGLGRSA
jgi:hypothetical protein